MSDDVRNRPGTVLARRYETRWGFDVYDRTMRRDAPWIYELALMRDAPARGLSLCLIATVAALWLAVWDALGYPSPALRWMILYAVGLVVLFHAAYLRRVVVEVSQ